MLMNLDISIPFEDKPLELEQRITLVVRGKGLLHPKSSLECFAPTHDDSVNATVSSMQEEAHLQI